MRTGLLAILISVIACRGLFGQTNSWNGITPLSSTRVDVERQLGAGKEGTYYGEVDYEKDNKRVTVNYSQAFCDRGWNVPKDTVTSIAFDPREIDASKSANELKLVENKYFVSGDDAFYGTWTDPENGVQYYFMNMSQQLQRIKFIPTRKNNDRRCDGFPPYVPEAQYYRYESRLFYNPKKGKPGDLDSIYTSLYNIISQAKRSNGKYRAYALIYFDDKLPFRTYRTRVVRLRMIAARIKKQVGEDIEIIEGGVNPENEIEFYLLPKEWKPPAPAPMLASPQFETKKRATT